MKCGICGTDERVVYLPKTGWGSGGLAKDEDGNFIPQLDGDGTVVTRFMYDLADVNNHKRVDHNEEYVASKAKGKATKANNERLAFIENKNTGKVERAGREAIAVPTLEYDEHWELRGGRRDRKTGPYTVGLSCHYMNSYTADSARRTVADGMGQQPALMMSLQHVVGITDSDVAYLAGLDEQIVALQAARNDAAAAIYENRPSITNDHVADVADAEVATMREFHGRAAFFGISEDEALVDEAVENMLEAAMGNDPGKFFV